MSSPPLPHEQELRHSPSNTEAPLPDKHTPNPTSYAEKLKTGTANQSQPAPTNHQLPSVAADHSTVTTATDASNPYSFTQLHAAVQPHTAATSSPNQATDASNPYSSTQLPAAVQPHTAATSSPEPRTHNPADQAHTDYINNNTPPAKDEYGSVHPTCKVDLLLKKNEHFNKSNEMHNTNKSANLHERDKDNTKTSNSSDREKNKLINDQMVEQSLSKGGALHSMLQRIPTTMRRDVFVMFNIENDPKHNLDTQRRTLSAEELINIMGKPNTTIQTIATAISDNEANDQNIPMREGFSINMEGTLNQAKNDPSMKKNESNSSAPVYLTILLFTPYSRDRAQMAEIIRTAAVKTAASSSNKPSPGSEYHVTIRPHLRNAKFEDIKSSKPLTNVVNIRTSFDTERNLSRGGKQVSKVDQAENTKNIRNANNANHRLLMSPKFSNISGIKIDILVRLGYSYLGLAEKCPEWKLDYNVHYDRVNSNTDYSADAMRGNRTYIFIEAPLSALATTMQCLTAATGLLTMSGSSLEIAAVAESFMNKSFPNYVNPDFDWQSLNPTFTLATQDKDIINRRATHEMEHEDLALLTGTDLSKTFTKQKMDANETNLLRFSSSSKTIKLPDIPGRKQRSITHKDLTSSATVKGIYEALLSRHVTNLNNGDNYDVVLKPAIKFTSLNGMPVISLPGTDTLMLSDCTIDVMRRGTNIPLPITAANIETLSSMLTESIVQCKFEDDDHQYRVLQSLATNSNPLIDALYEKTDMKPPPRLKQTVKHKTIIPEEMLAEAKALLKIETLKPVDNIIDSHFGGFDRSNPKLQNLNTAEVHRSLREEHAERQTDRNGDAIDTSDEESTDSAPLPKFTQTLTDHATFGHSVLQPAANKGAPNNNVPLNVRAYSDAPARGRGRGRGGLPAGRGRGHHRPSPATVEGSAKKVKPNATHAGDLELDDPNVSRMAIDEPKNNSGNLSPPRETGTLSTPPTAAKEEDMQIDQDDTSSSA